MPQNSSRFRPQADALETRMVLSAVLTPAGLEVVHNRIGRAVDRLAATGNVVQADAALERAVQNIPDNAALLPTLDAALVSPRVSTRTLMADINRFIRDLVPTSDVVVPTVTPQRTNSQVAPSSLPSAATLPSSYSVSIANTVNSDLNVSFTQDVNGTPIQLTGVFIRAGATATFVPVITENSSPITVSVQSQAVGYWEVTAPANFSQLQIQYMYGRCYFYFH